MQFVTSSLYTCKEDIIKAWLMYFVLIPGDWTASCWICCVGLGYRRVYLHIRDSPSCMYSFYIRM